MACYPTTGKANKGPSPETQLRCLAVESSASTQPTYAGAALISPDRIAQDATDPASIRSYKVIPELGSPVLRVAHRLDSDDISWLPRIATEEQTVPA